MSLKIGSMQKGLLPLRAIGLKSARTGILVRSRHIHSEGPSTTQSATAAAATTTTTTQTSSLSTLDISEDAVEAANAASTFSSQLLAASSDAFLALPQTLGGASYAASIVVLTIALRSAVTLPMIVWQRRRVRRVQEQVVPAAKAWLADARYALRTEYRRAGKSYEQYVTALNLMAKKQFKTLAAQYKCRPLPTMLIPPLVHIPIFIGTTLTIREACNRSFGALQTSAQAIEAGTNTLTTDSNLAALALESLAWCPSLTDVDPYSAFPLAVGITALLNVETQAKIRQRMAELRDAASAGPEEAEARPVQVSGAASPANTSQARSATRVARPAPVIPKILQKKALSTSSATKLASSPDNTSMTNKVSTVEMTSNNASAARSRAITNVLRFASIMFIPIAAASPVAVNVYWLTSNLFSLTQNLVLAYRDRPQASKVTNEVHPTT